jgi:UDP-2,3-diacylglucosamine pyrophosphatase LpxH
MKFFNHYKTIVVSDIPLAASAYHFKKLIYFIKHTSCDKLIFTGEIIRGWQSKKTGKIYRLHNKFLKTLLKKSEQNNTKIIFVTGNEGNFEENIQSFQFYNFSFAKKFIFNSAGNNFYVIPGDISNKIKYKLFNLYPLYNLKYSFFLWLNKKFNTFRLNQGQSYISLLKNFSDQSESKISILRSLIDYKENINSLTKNKNCEGFICSHQTHSGIYNLGGLTFLCSGYWTETLNVLAESNYGKWEIVSYDKVKKDKLEAMHHAAIIEELFEEEHSIITNKLES